MNYSLDMIKKAAFERELEHLVYQGCKSCELDKDKEFIKNYLKERIKEIDEKYEGKI